MVERPKDNHKVMAEPEEKVLDVIAIVQQMYPGVTQPKASKETRRELLSLLNLAPDAGAAAGELY